MEEDEPNGRTDGQGRTETGRRIPVLVVRWREWTLWVLAGLVYLAYLMLVTMNSPSIWITAAMAALPALRLMPKESLGVVGFGTGWFVSALNLEAYTLFGLVMAGQMLALAGARSSGWGWLIGMAVGFVGGSLWASR